MINELSDIKGIRRWQLIGFSEEKSIKLYNIAKGFFVELPNISLDDVTSRLMAAMSDVFIRGRDVDVFLNSLTQNNCINLVIQRKLNDA